MRVFHFRSALLSLVAVLAGSLANPAPAAITYRDASAGAACHAANGALASKFTYNLNFVTNVGTTDAYVICSLPMDDASSLPDNIHTLSVAVQTSNPGATVTCVAQNGSFYDGINHIYNSASRSYTAIGANAAFFLTWDGAALHRDGIYAVLTINCKLPPGTKLGLIQRWEGYIPE
jgi:hypothetical protein